MQNLRTREEIVKRIKKLDDKGDRSQDGMEKSLFYSEANQLRWVLNGTTVRSLDEQATITLGECYTIHKAMAHGLREMDNQDIDTIKGDKIFKKIGKFITSGIEINELERERDGVQTLGALFG